MFVAPIRVNSRYSRVSPPQDSILLVFLGAMIYLVNSYHYQSFLHGGRK